MRESRGTFVVERRRDAPVRVRNDVEELYELVHIFTPTSRGEHVLGQMEYVLPLPIVGVKESLKMAPRTLDRVRMSRSMVIDESDRTVHSLVRVAIRLKLLRVIHELCVINVETLHRKADVFLRHRHLKPSFTGASKYQDIWQPHTLHHSSTKQRHILQ